ncbi:hypothetical protein SESBI_46081 [Sesbania bispinosa]|nr:hypothetical protein SESBI_46081 [Sesbania bispinosa]
MDPYFEGVNNVGCRKVTTENLAPYTIVADSCYGHFVPRHKNIRALKSRSTNHYAAKDVANE